MQRLQTALLATLLSTAVQAHEATPCLECFIIHVGVPHLVAGPGPQFDSPVPFLRTPDGGLRGYVGERTTWRLEGPSIQRLAFKHEPTIGPGKAPGFDDCGAWLMAVYSMPDKVIGWYHAESGCGTVHYRKSIGYAESLDGGLTFQKPTNNLILDPAFASDPHNVGEGDFGVIQWGGYHLLYALQATDPSWGTIVARAPIVAEGKPGTWIKYFEGRFSEPGVGGEASQLGYWGLSPILYAAPEGTYVALFAEDPWFKGIRVSFGEPPAGPFASLPEPLIPLDDASWQRPAPTELYTYTHAVNDQGERRFTRHFHLFASVVMPGESLDKRYLLRRDVWWRQTQTKQPYSVRLRLARYEHAGEHWSTTAYPPGYGSPEKHLGYLLTKEHSELGTIRLNDCLKGRDHFISTDAGCEGGTKLRTLGWALARKAKDAVWLFSCLGKERFESIRRDCEGMGKNNGRLGYLLRK